MVRKTAVIVHVHRPWVYPKWVEENIRSTIKSEGIETSYFLRSTPRANWNGAIPVNSSNGSIDHELQQRIFDTDEVLLMGLYFGRCESNVLDGLSMIKSSIEDIKLRIPLDCVVGRSYSQSPDYGSRKLSVPFRGRNDPRQSYAYIVADRQDTVEDLALLAAGVSRHTRLLEENGFRCEPQLYEGDRPEISWNLRNGMKTMDHADNK